MNFKKEYNRRVKMINDSLRDLTKFSAPGTPEIIHEAMTYSLFSPGKRLRPVIMLAVYDMLGTEGLSGTEPVVLPFACALEMIHVYSLIHDDLPSLDNDDLRRGLPANHIKFGEAIAILAGDALLNRAYETMSKACLEYALESLNMSVFPPIVKFLEAMETISQAAGVEGMIGGQVADICAENKVVDEDMLVYIQIHKTSKLFEAAFKAGACMAHASQASVNKMLKIARRFGMAFQIRDDLLDITGNQDEIGKPVGSDQKNHKATLFTVYGEEGMANSKLGLAVLCSEIRSMLKTEKKSEFLLDLVDDVFSDVL
ncbi:MAG: polyprenyl synthetase family protein [Defluviitaleaceae bacterium]|nr:polyprenyl synthetase family protein [Defluviitaleaceae bacterium]